MTRFERVIRVIVGVFMLACANNISNVWLMVPAFACAGMMTLSGILGWCPPLPTFRKRPRANALNIPDATAFVNIDV